MTSGIRSRIVRSDLTDLTLEYVTSFRTAVARVDAAWARCQASVGTRLALLFAFST